MKKIVASVGLVALGASGLHAAGGSSLTAEASKPWSISASLRGFYDDNINGAPNKLDLGQYSRDSYGFEVTPSVSLLLPLEQGSLTANYTYSYKYYDKQLAGSDGHDTQTHMFNLGFDHAFSERYSLAIKDSFVIGQEPDILRAGNAMETFQRLSGDNMRNAGTINFDGQVTRTLGYQIGYGNNWFDYDNTGPIYGAGGVVTPSTAGLLNRIEHMPHFDLRWTIQPQTIGVLGYQYKEVGYTGDENIAGSSFQGYVKSDLRNSRSHYGYLGLDHTFRPDLTGSFRIGAQYIDYYNDPTADNQVSPYFLANLRYAYMADSFVELGVTTDRNATDVLGASNNGYTMDQQSTVVYLSLTHKITPKLFGSIIGQYQNSEFNGGLYDSQSENFYSAGVNLEYRFNPHFAAHVGYNYDALNSDLGDLRNMDRNRVYVGVTARY